MSTIGFYGGEPLTVAVDFDDTLLFMKKEWLWRFYCNTGYWLPYGAITRWEMHELIPSELKDALYAARTPEMYLTGNIYPMQGAVWMVRELQRQGRRVVVVTNDSAEFVAAKRVLLRRFFPELVDSLVVARDKREAVRCDFLVDDHPRSGADWYPAHPWNEKIPDDQRLGDLSLVPDLISYRLSLLACGA